MLSGSVMPASQLLMVAPVTPIFLAKARWERPAASRAWRIRSANVVMCLVYFCKVQRPLDKVVISRLIMCHMTKSELLNLLGVKPAELARILKISRSAISQWPDDEPVPERQELRLRYELRPEAFEGPGVAAAYPEIRSTPNPR